MILFSLSQDACGGVFVPPATDALIDRRELSTLILAEDTVRRYELGGASSVARFFDRGV